MISESIFLERLEAGENAATEFKAGQFSKKKIAELAVAFANSVDEGWLILGIKEGRAGRSVIGLTEPEKISQLIYEACQKLCRPPLEPVFEPVVTEGRTVIVAIIKSDAAQRPYQTASGAFTIRTPRGMTRVVSLIEGQSTLTSGRALLGSLTVRHFRSLYDVKINFKPITLIIGPNASGKSNLIKALQFLQDGMTGDNSQWEISSKRIEERVWFGNDEHGNRPDRMEFEISVWIKDRPLSEAVTYELEISWGDSRLRVEKEKLSYGLGSNLTRSLFERDLNSVSLTDDPRQPQKRRSLFLRSPGRLYFREYLSTFEHSPVEAFVQFVQGWRFINVDVEKARQATVDVSLSRPGEIPALQGDGSNLAEVLLALSLHDEERFEEITRRLRQAIGFPHNIRVRQVPTLGGLGEARITFTETAFQDQEISPSSISDGTIRLLTLLTALIGDARATLVCIEEPDHGLHPLLLLRLADTMRSAVSVTSDRELHSPPQIIVTTHSPDLMDCFDLSMEASYLQVLIAERNTEDGKTQFLTTNAPEFSSWLAQYRLGEALRRNVFGTAR